MAHPHGDTSSGHESHGGTHGLGWELLDSVMLACFVVVCGLLGELLYKQWRTRRLAGVRYDLTPAGRAATDVPEVPDPDTESN